MSKFLHGLGHVGLIVLQVINAGSAAIPPPYNIVVAAVLGSLQAALALVNHAKDQP
jgi:hypothetical protein